MRPLSPTNSQSAHLSSPASRRRCLRIPFAMALIGAASAIAFVALHQEPMPEEVALASIERLFASEAGLTR